MFVGDSIIVGGVKFGPDVVVAAGSVVTKGVPKGEIVGGNLARIIGSFYDLKQKRDKKDGGKYGFNPEEESRLHELWYEFGKGRSQ